MYILAIETTGYKGSIALLCGDEVVGEKTTTETMSHLKYIMEMSRGLMEEKGIVPQDLSAVAVSAGPGSFTGIRIGVTCARTIGQMLNVPVIAVSSLEIFKEKLDGRHGVAVIFNARRNQVYGAIYRADGSEALAPGPYMIDDVIEVAAKIEDIIFYGDGVDAYEEKVAGFQWAKVEDRYQSAAMLGKAAAISFKKGEAKPYFEVEPEYMRKSEAEQKLSDGSLMRERLKKMERFKN